MTTIVFHAPHEGADLVWQQMRAAHRYRCALVEIERGRRAAVREVEGEYGVAPALARVAAAKLAEAETYAAIAKHRARSRKRDEPEALRAAHKAAAEACREAVTALRAVRDSLRSLCKVCREADASDPCVHASEAAKGLAKNAYEHSGCYWGQRAIVDEAAADSRCDSYASRLDGNWIYS